MAQRLQWNRTCLQRVWHKYGTGSYHNHRGTSLRANKDGTPNHNRGKFGFYWLICRSVHTQDYSQVECLIYTATPTFSDMIITGIYFRQKLN